MSAPSESTAASTLTSSADASSSSTIDEELAAKLIERGLHSQKEGNWNEAATQFTLALETAIKQSSHHLSIPVLHLHLAESSLETNRLDDAKQSLTAFDSMRGMTADSIRPFLVRSMYLRSRLLIATGKPKVALSLIDRTLKPKKSAAIQFTQDEIAEYRDRLIVLQKQCRDMMESTIDNGNGHSNDHILAPSSSSAASSSSSSSSTPSIKQPSSTAASTTGKKSARANRSSAENNASAVPLASASSSSPSSVAAAAAAAASHVNIAAYKFVTFDNIEEMRPQYEETCKRLNLKGTILLTPEGINMFLSGTRAHIDEYLAWVRADARFSDLEVKESYSAEQSHKRMRVKIKKEIITMLNPLIKPEEGRAPFVDAHTLKRWLDAGVDDSGKPIALVDTRNDYEVDLGTFNNTVDYRIKKFTEFPAVIAAHKPDFDKKTVVTFCTGGIRCEKAAIHMQNIGYDSVYQLEGGILKYFEEVGGDHYKGECFVFDERTALNSNLEPADLETEGRSDGDISHSDRGEGTSEVSLSTAVVPVPAQ